MVLVPPPIYTFGKSDDMIMYLAFRVFMFNEASKTFCLLAHNGYHDHCVLGVSHLLVEEPGSHRRALVLSTATDGSVAFWDISRTLQQLHLLGKCDTHKSDAAHDTSCDSCAASEGTCDIDPSGGSTPRCASSVSAGFGQDAVTIATAEMEPPVAVLKVHQSGVNALSLFHLRGKVHGRVAVGRACSSCYQFHVREVNDCSFLCLDSRYLLATGGDDNSICVVQLDVMAGHEQTLPGITEAWRMVCQSAHAAQITGIYHVLLDTSDATYRTLIMCSNVIRPIRC